MDHANTDNFSDAFTAARKAIKDEAFHKDWKRVLNALQLLAGHDGLNPGKASALGDLRKKIKKHSKDLTKEDEGILLGTGDVDPKRAVAAQNGKIAEKAAALKLLRHVYMLRKSGSHKVWICSLPAGYRNWPHGEVKGAQVATLKAKLTQTAERFSEDDKKHLSNATQEGLKWCHKTLISLAQARKDKGDGRAFVRRWFADEKASDAELDAMISTLAAGFKKITAVMKSGGLVLTDHPLYRGTQFEGSEAFVTVGAKRDRLDVVYVESAFFGTNNLLTGLTNWTRILVHELTHREAATVDVPGRYAWGGIKPTFAAFPSAKAITNADSWAWYCADVAGALTDKNRNDALKP
ncbi:M35 family metallo-endopeptidase [Inquilinus sp. CAU 1745]|uniref:M35 family metallo-endopeptidase n=1 Tax=Inquilinus sp. CAU 1745 TaxID=3140369 RepID=UPI00325A9CA2